MDNKINVLLLAMSTLPPVNKTSDFLIDSDLGGGIVSGCISQLEPVPKMMLKKMPNEELKIITICTEETRNSTRDDFGGNTAYSFFENRMKAVSTKVNIIEINIDEQSPIYGVREAARTIRELQPQIGQFWIDTHGGFRDISFVMEAIVSLLKVYGIIPDEILGVRYGSKDTKNVIVNQKSSFDMLDFVSGMNEFINFGSANQLLTYFNNKKDSESELGIINAISIVSDGTTQSNSNQYEQGLDELGRSLNEIDDNDALLSLFKEYIEDSYGVLLDRNKRTPLDIVKRCVDKGLYQQSLTILETLMPREIMKRGIIRYAPEDFHSIRPAVRVDRWSDEESFVFNRFVSNNNVNSYGDCRDETRYLEAYFAGNFVNTAFLGHDNGNPETRIQVSMIYNNQNSALPIGSRVINSDWEDAGKLMHLHRALKDCRNKFNHCNPQRAEIDIIIKALNEYVIIAERLFERYKYE